MLAARADPITIAVAAPGFPAAGEYVGLTADPALPPLLHSRLALDWESWWLFEQMSIAMLGESSDGLGRLALVVEDVREWRVGLRPLAEHVQGAFDRARHSATVSPAPSAATVAKRCADAIAAVPDAWRAQALDALSVSASGPVEDVVMRRYLAAHAFANWTAYQGEGLRAWYRAVESAACLLAHTADPGRADLILRHLADASALTARWNRAETHKGPRP